SPGSRRCQIVLFVSSREMRLCSVSSFSSTTFLLLTEKLFTSNATCNPLYFPQTSLPNPPQSLAAHSFISRRSQREANYSNPSRWWQAFC
ncbi:MAG: hypothetical protein WBD81_09675, partial [Collimonas pratensis]|uniref:hypothetical protein n=1 Tax=Collimonas pratensis TaxID=279113 RepID=UPI003C76AA31